MAIKKDIENEYKAKFNYHKISEVRIFASEGDISLFITTESYVDKEARHSGAKAVKMENIITHADFAMSPFYALLKAKFPMFQNGIDDLDEDTEKTETRPETLFTQQTPAGDLIDRWNEEDLIEKHNNESEE